MLRIYVTFPESRTIRAIGELRHNYPYAAALLSYVVVERVLKRYALNHWKDPSLAGARVPNKIKRHGGKQLRHLSTLTRRQRLDQVLCEMTLGQVETLLARPQSEKSATDRNEVMHSNLYLKEESTLSRPAQQAKNQARFDKALRHLRRALVQFANLTIVNKNGVLVAQPNMRLKLPGAHK